MCMAHVIARFTLFHKYIKIRYQAEKCSHDPLLSRKYWTQAIPQC